MKELCLEGHAHGALLATHSLPHSLTHTPYSLPHSLTPTPSLPHSLAPSLPRSSCSLPPSSAPLARPHSLTHSLTEPLVFAWRDVHQRPSGPLHHEVSQPVSHTHSTHKTPTHCDLLLLTPKTSHMRTHPHTHTHTHAHAHAHTHTHTPTPTHSRSLSHTQAHKRNRAEIGEVSEGVSGRESDSARCENEVNQPATFGGALCASTGRVPRVLSQDSRAELALL